MFELTFSIFAICVPACFVAGFIDSIAGGGGLITVPTMLLAGVPPHYALGSNKAQSSVGTAVALYLFSRGSHVLWRMALAGVPFALLGSALGSELALHLSNELLGKVLIFLLVPTMCLTMLPRKNRTEEEAPLTGKKFWILMPLVCLVIGFHDGFFGPGTGTFFILAFHWILGRGLVKSSGTSKVLNLASNVAALAVFLWNGTVLFELAIPMIIASVAGNTMGSRYAMRVGAKAVRLFLMVSLCILLVTLVSRYFLS